MALSHDDAMAQVERIRLLELERAALIHVDSDIADKRIDLIGAEIEEIVVGLINDTHDLPDAEREAVLAALDKEEQEAGAEIDYIRDERPSVIEDADITW